MTKTYKHKVKGWTAELCESNPSWYRVNHYLNNYHLVHPELIEGCSDREEVVEKDWYDKFWEEVTGGKYVDYLDKETYREVLEKYIPKQKKFTRQEILRTMDGNIGRTNIVMDFLKRNNLLSDTD